MSFTNLEMSSPLIGTITSNGEHVSTFFGRWTWRQRPAGHGEPGRCQPGVAAARPARPLRRDAERNRQRILPPRLEVFTERGLEASLDEVARHAGVGVGTVYRRFPDKDDLVEALFMDRIDAVATLAEEAARGRRSVDRPGVPSWSAQPRCWPTTAACGS